MKKELKIFNQRISKKGVFDLNNVIKEIKEFLNNIKYDVDEKQNISKEKSNGIETIIEIVAEREIDDFFMYKLNIEFLVIKLSKVIVNNKKMDKGELEVRMVPKLVLDQKNKFHGWLGDVSFKIYRDYIIKDKINKVHAAKIYLDGMAVFDLIKHNLDLN